MFKFFKVSTLIIYNRYFIILNWIFIQADTHFSHLII